MRMVPSCIKCGSQIHETAIKIHINAHTAQVVGDMHFKEMLSKQDNLHNCFEKHCDGAIIIEDRYLKEWNCPICAARNCIKCQKIHRGNTQCYVPPPPKPSYMNTSNYLISNEE